MKLDSGNRSFFALVATALVPYLLLGLFGCGLLSVLGFRLATEGLGGLEPDGRDLGPALVFFAVVSAGTVVAALSVRRQVRATRALATALERHRALPPPEVDAAAARTGLTGTVQFVEDPTPFSFTYGLLAPRVVVGRGLTTALHADELTAVLHHERYHVRNWDTLKVVMAPPPVRSSSCRRSVTCAPGTWRVGSSPRIVMPSAPLVSDRWSVPSVTCWSDPPGRSSAPLLPWADPSS